LLLRLLKRAVGPETIIDWMWFNMDNLLGLLTPEERQFLLRVLHTYKDNLQSIRAIPDVNDEAIWTEIYSCIQILKKLSRIDKEWKPLSDPVIPYLPV
jgi:hypothetical protein